MRTRGKVVAIAGLAGMAAAGCAVADERVPVAQTPVASTAGAARVLSCENALGPVRRPAGRLDAIAGPVRFTSALRAARQPHRHFEPTKSRDFTLKSPLVVAPGADVRIAVASPDRGHASLMYMVTGTPPNRVRSGATAVDVTSCDDGPPTGWQGAIVVDGARCVRLRVTHDGTATTLRIPVGKGTCRRG